jgi:cell wall-associated NlpC family hydrolase
MELDGKMPGCVQHFGVYLGDGKFIHTLKKVHSCISNVRDPYWSNRIRGYYKWRG